MAKLIYFLAILDGMRRKIIKQGTATLTVSLPAKWTKKLNLRAGDEVEVEEHDSSLVLGSLAVPKKKEITIEVTEANKHDIKQILTHLYRKGLDTIVLKGVSTSALSQISATVKDLLLGFEVTERDGKQCKITNISEPTEEKYDVLLRRAFLIIKEIHAMLAHDFKTGSFPNSKEIEELRKQQDKFILFCMRILTRERGSMIEWELLKSLMHVQHAYYYLYTYAAQNPVKSSKINDLLQELEDYLDRKSTRLNSSHRL